MATGSDILKKLIPTGGWVITGEDFSSIIYDDGVSPITKKQFDDAAKEINATLESQAALKATAKAALLERLGITSEEAALLLG